MASPNTVHVKNIAASTDDKEIRDFFSFWYVTPACCGATWDPS